MLFFVGRNTPTPVKKPSKQKFHTYQHILTTIFNINANSTGRCIQLSVAKSFNPLLPININLQLVVCKLLVMPSLSQHESRCPMQRISLWFFLSANSHVINSYLLSRPNQQNETFEYSRSNFFSMPEGENSLLSSFQNTDNMLCINFQFVQKLLTLSCDIELDIHLDCFCPTGSY